MDNKNIKVPSFILVVIFGFFLFFYTNCDAIDEKGEYKKSIEHIKFGGRITGKIDLFDYYFISEVDLSYTNCDYYDIRDSSDVWSFVIKGDKAGILSIDDGVEIGDSISFNGKDIYYYRKNAAHYYYRSGAIIFNRIYDDNDIRDKHKL